MAKTSIFESRSDEKRWINEIKEIVKEVKININVPVCIFNIPATVASSKPEAYMPQLIGLGPYHHGDPNLHDMERYKLAAASRHQKQQFNTLRFEQLVEELMESEDDIRACYHKYLDIEGKTLMWIMAIDGLFLQEFLQMSHDSIDLVDNEGRKLLSHDMVLRDVMLLENQIPFLLFNKFISIKNSLDTLHGNPLPSILMTFCCSISPVQPIKEDLNGILHYLHYNWLDLDGVLNCSHLLDLLYHMIVPYLANQKTDQEAPTTQTNDTKSDPSQPEKNTNSDPSQPENNTNSGPSQPENSSDSCQNFTTLLNILSSLPKIPKIMGAILTMISKVPDMFFQRANGKGSGNSENSGSAKPENSHPKVEKIIIPSASTLSKKAGVEFCPTTGDNPTIKFNAKEKKFYLPVITLDVHSEVIIRNLIAYEALTMSGSFVFGRFTDLLDWLIDSPEDVELLREKKIIYSKLKRDHEVFRLFDGIGKSVGLTNAPSIDKTIEDVNKFYDKSRWVRFDRGVNMFVYDLWKVWTIAASILLLLLTGVQSFCSVYTCPNMIKFNSTASN